MCRELICPPHLSPVNGECVQAFAQTNGFHIRHLFLVKPTERLIVAPNEMEAKTIMTMTYDLLMDKIRHRRCKKCASWGIGVEDYVANYILEINLLTTPSCPLSFLISQIEHAELASVSVDINGVATDFFVENIDGELPKTSSVSVMFVNDAICWNSGVRVNAINSCPRVELSGLDYMTALDNNYIHNDNLHNKYNLSTFTEEELSNITFDVCVSDYFLSASRISLKRSNFILNTYQIGTVIFLSILTCAVTLAYRVASPHPYANSSIIAANVCLIAVQCLLFIFTIGVSNTLYCAMVKFIYQLFWLATVLIAHLYNIFALKTLIKKKTMLYFTISSFAISVSLLAYSFRSIYEEPDCAGLFLYKADMTNNISAFFIVIITIVVMETSLFVVEKEWRETGCYFYFFLGLVAVTWTVGCLHDVYDVPFIGILFFVSSSVLGVYMFCVFGPLIRILTIKRNK